MTTTETKKSNLKAFGLGDTKLYGLQSFDAIMLPKASEVVDKFTLPKYLDKIVLVEMKATRKPIKDAGLAGFFFWATQREYDRAAKLINLYLKARFTCGGNAGHPHVAALHPPIDSLLLIAFNRTRSPNDRLPVHWSTFDSRAYQRAIGALREARKRAPLWTAESLWQGHT